LIQELCSPNNQTGSLGISFSSNLNNVSFDFAMVELVPGTPGVLSVQAFENTNLISTSLFNSVVPPGHPGGEGIALITGTFDQLVLTGDTSDTLLAIDNIGVSEPTSTALLGAGLAGFVLVWRRRKVDWARINPGRGAGPTAKFAPSLKQISLAVGFCRISPVVAVRRNHPINVSARDGSRAAMQRLRGQHLDRFPHFSRSANFRS